MELDRLIDYIDGNLENRFPKNIIVPEFTFNNVLCKNVDFVFMGLADNNDNFGKAIYLSKDCLPDVQVSMDSLLESSPNGDVGTGTIGIAAAESLNTAIYDITKKHLQEYTREYDGKVHTEKVFFPLECEVFGITQFSADKATLSKYPRWEGFKKSKDSTIKYIDYRQDKYETWFWWEANKSRSSGGFCDIDYNGRPNYGNSYYSNYGVGLAFCI